MKAAARSYRSSVRVRAAEQTKQLILHAAREQFLDAAYDEVTLSGIASIAGVTQQTVLNHFENKEQLFGFVARQLAGEIDAGRATVSSGDIAGAVRLLVREYETTGDAGMRFLAVEHRLPILADVLAMGRQKHRAWLQQVFAEELPDDARQRRRTLTALYAATDVGVWKLLRRDLGTSRAETVQIMRRLVAGALAQ